MKKVGLFPGSFDPFTKGHEVIIKKSIPLFDEVIIGVGINSTKEYMFDTNKRIEHIRSLFQGHHTIRVEQFEKLTVRFCEEVGANFIIRGLRNSKDFEYERSIAHMNFDLSGIDTVFLLTEQKYAAISSSIVREIHANGGPIDSFVTNPNLLV